MSIKAVIFDKDGTLMDFESFWVTVSEYAIDEILKRTRCTTVTREAVLKSLDVENGIANINGILAQAPFPVMGRAIRDCLLGGGCTLTESEITATTIDAYHGNTDKGVVSPACEDIEGVLKGLKQKGMRLAVITTDDPVDTEFCLNKLGVYGLFDEIYTDDGVLPPKPDPFCLKLFAEKYGLEKDEILMVGDTLNDVRFAENSGIRVVGVAKALQNRAILEEHIDVVVDDISFIPDIVSKINDGAL